MSVCTADDSHSIARTCLQSNATCISTETTYRKALNEIRLRIKNASCKAVHIYAFNIPVEQLESAYSLLDKEEERKTMRVTYSHDNNFIVRYMPGRVHERAHVYWNTSIFLALASLMTPPSFSLPPGCMGVGGTTFQLGPRQKQADSAIQPTDSDFPSVILEVGSSESLGQLKVDAKLWIEHMPEVQLVIILSIDHPTPPHPNLPVINIELWRGMPPSRPVHSQQARTREGQMVWQANWTHTVTPLYILLSDIFRGQVPPAYGDNDRVHLDTVAWRQFIIDSW